MPNSPNRIQELLEAADASGAFSPWAYYDPHGDCIELFLQPDDFIAQRLDRWVTVYHSRATGVIVGSQIKNLQELLTEYPGLSFYIRDRDQVRISAILGGPASRQSDEEKFRVYESIMEQADKSRLRIAHLVA